MSATQTVFRLTSRNGFDGIQAFHEPIPTIDKNEVLVKVRSVALNYRDIAIATSTYPIPVKDQMIPCSDFAGEAVQVGSQVIGISVGDAVTAPNTPDLLYGLVKDTDDSLGGMVDGVLAQYYVVPAHLVIKLPKSCHSFAEWAAVITAGLTAWNALYGAAPLKPGQSVLILGTGGVSLAALVFAKAAGAVTIITSSSDEKLALMKSKYGADHTINYRTNPDWAHEVKLITNGKGVDNVIENGGIGTLEKSLEAVSWGGIVSLIGFLAPPPEKIPDFTWPVLLKGVSLRGIRAGSKQQLEDIIKLLGSHDLKIPVDKEFGFDREEVIKAFEYVKSGKHIGKVCINLD